MNNILLKHAKTRLAKDAKPRCSEVSDSSFAGVLAEVQDGITNLHEYCKDLGRSQYYSDSGCFAIDTQDLDELFEESLENLFEGESDEDRMTGSHTMRIIAGCGHTTARLLLGVHSVCDAASKEDIERGETLLLWCAKDLEEHDFETDWIYDILNLHLRKHKDNNRLLEAEYIENGAKIVCSDGQALSIDRERQDVSELIRFSATVGNIRINVDWYESPLEIIVGESGGHDTIDVYAIPSIPLPQIIRKMCKEVGTENVNELAGMVLYDEENSDESLPAVFLRAEPLGEDSKITPLLCPQCPLILPCGICINFETADTDKLSWECADNYLWTIFIPDSWDVMSLVVQRRLTKYVNNLMPRIAEKYLTWYYEEMTRKCSLPQGKCEVCISGKDCHHENEDGGYDLTVPYTLVKLSEDSINNYLLSPYMTKLERTMFERYTKWLAFDPMAVGFTNLRLSESPRQRESMQEKYGKMLFG